MVDTATKILSTLTLLSDIAIMVLVLSLICFRKQTRQFFAGRSGKVVAKNALRLALIVALAATGGSLFYSDIAGFEPCKLCWIQRIFMYPLVILLAMGVLKKDRNIADYGLALSIIGAPIALYHYYLQRGGNPFIPCSTVGYSVSCAKTFVMSYGYITIPMMALTAFVLIIIFLGMYKKFSANPNHR